MLEVHYDHSTEGVIGQEERNKSERAAMTGSCKDHWSKASVTGT